MAGQLEGRPGDSMIQHSHFPNGELTGRVIDRVNFLRSIICWHELNTLWTWDRSIFPHTEEILKRRRIFSLQFLSSGQITFSFSILIKNSIKKKQFGMWMHISYNSQCFRCKNLIFLLLCDLASLLLFLQVTIHFSTLQRDVIKKELHLLIISFSSTGQTCPTVPMKLSSINHTIAQVGKDLKDHRVQPQPNHTTLTLTTHCY